jgi:pyridoxine 5-phosphate synthase
MVSDRHEAGNARPLRLYVNIDHVATLRQARGGVAPDPVAAAALCEAVGADGITAHLREDRRHVQDADLVAIARIVRTVLNFEMAVTEEMVALAESIRPYQVTLVPERRQEVTTEGGLDVGSVAAALPGIVNRLHAVGTRVALFIDPDLRMVDRSAAARVDAIELHTGPYSHRPTDGGTVDSLARAAAAGVAAGLAVHAGHGLSAQNLGPVAAIPEIEELNIGHAIMSRAIFVGLPMAVAEIRAAMHAARPSTPYSAQHR